MTQKEILKIFKDVQAVKKGHFLLTSGLHSSTYIQTALILQYPHLARKICVELAKKFKDCKVDVVISPAVGGIVLGHEVAHFFNARAIYAEREEGRMRLRRGFNIDKGERALLVENVITTGSSVHEVTELIKKSDAFLVGVGALVNRASKKLTFGGKRTRFLLNLEIPTFEEAKCPLCKKNIPYTKQGSKWIKK